MIKKNKSQEEILKKLQINKLNPMQLEVHEAVAKNSSVVVLSPTGSGKTLAFLLPILGQLDPENPNIQNLILVPSRELAIQIEQVVREMGSGFKANAVYGGRAFAKDRIDLQHTPAILIGTPGRIADHIRRETIGVEGITTLVLDEFDKSLEVGFEEEMSEILEALPNLKKRILTSATQEIRIPKFAGVSSPVTIDFLDEGVSELRIKTVAASGREKFDSLIPLLSKLEGKPGIIFCNFKDSIEAVSDQLKLNKIPHGCFHGGLEQKERERTLIKFRNGTYKVLLATDLAARGLDIPEIQYIIHYQLPFKSQEFTHRNGRTARMNKQGTAYVLHYTKESLPDFIKPDPVDPQEIKKSANAESINWRTIFISGGRKDKISKGDIAGLLIKQGHLGNDEVGAIELKQDCAFVSLPSEKANGIVNALNNVRLKKKKVRIKLI